MRPPGGNVTFLFTDIERSSELWETHPRTMGRSLAQHDDLIRATVADHGGYIFKTIGDAFCVVFERTLSWCQDRAADALRHYHVAQALYRDLRVTEQVGIIEAMLGLTERKHGNNAAARIHFERAKVLGEELRSERIIAMAVYGLGSLAGDEGDFAFARARQEHSLASFRLLGDQWVVALITGSLGRVCCQEGGSLGLPAALDLAMA